MDPSGKYQTRTGQPKQTSTETSVGPERNAEAKQRYAHEQDREVDIGRCRQARLSKPAHGAAERIVARGREATDHDYGGRHRRSQDAEHGRRSRGRVRVVHGTNLTAQ